MPFSAAIDTAIGLMMVYLILSLICTGINEAIAGLLRLRARNLFKEVSRALANERLSAAFWQGGLIQSLSRVRLDGAKSGVSVKPGTAPSYLDRGDFARALIETLRRIDSDTAGNQQGRPFEAVLARIDQNSPFSEIIRTLGIDATSTIEEAKSAFAHWFDQVMERASGVYKRWMSLLSFAIATALACAINADSLQIARAFWQDDTLRAAMVEAATRLPTSHAEALPDLAYAVDRLPSPLGWSMAMSIGEDLNARLAKLVGLFMTTVAVSLGAPFWFDVLSRFVAIRNSGRPRGEKRG